MLQWFRLVSEKHQQVIEVIIIINVLGIIFFFILAKADGNEGAEEVSEQFNWDQQNFPQEVEKIDKNIYDVPNELNLWHVSSLYGFRSQWRSNRGHIQ